MRADLFEIRVDGILYVADQPVVREGLRVTLMAYQGAASNLLATDRLNLDRQTARDKFARTMAGDEPEDGIERTAWEVRYRDFSKALWTVRETLMQALAPGEPPPAESPPEPDAPQLAAGLALLDRPDVLELAGETVRQLGYAGRDTTQPQLLTLALVSRSLARPINIIVTGPSSAGKSHMVGLVSKLFPEDATYILAGMSERVLAYSDADLRHRFLVIGEASALHHDGLGASLLRNLAWEGHIRYEVVEKSPDGQQVTRIVEREGPTGFISTTTGRVESELATRVLPVYVDDTPQGTRIILQDAARRAAGAIDEPPDLERWWAAFWWLQERGDHEVVIPFAPALEGKYPDKLVRTRRDFQQLINLISAAAILHQRQRQRDQQGRIVATVDDYRAIYEVAAPVYAALTSEGLTPAVREAVAAVVELIDEGSEFVTIAALSERLKLDRSAVHKRADRAISGGWLVNIQEKRRGAKQLQPGAAMPTVSTGLPHPDEIEVVQPEEPPPDGENKNSALQVDVQQSNANGFPDVEGKNSWKTPDFQHVPTLQPQPQTVGQLDMVGNSAMSNCLPHVDTENPRSWNVGHQGTRTLLNDGGNVQPRPTNDEVVGHVEWITAGHTCLTCGGTTFWKPAEAKIGVSPRCVTCHPPKFPSVSK